MAKYIYYTGHKAGHYNEDQVHVLKAKTLLEAMNEITAAKPFANDENLFGIWLYERVEKNRYNQIMGSLDGVSFIPDNNSSTIIRHTFKANGKTEEYFSFLWKAWTD